MATSGKPAPIAPRSGAPLGFFWSQDFLNFHFWIRNMARFSESRKGVLFNISELAL